MRLFVVLLFTLPVVAAEDAMVFRVHDADLDRVFDYTWDREPFRPDHDPTRVPATPIGRQPAQNVLRLLGDLAPLPPGSEARYVPGAKRVLLRTTPEAHTLVAEVLGALMRALPESGPQFELDFVWVEFPGRELWQAPEFRAGGGLSGAEVLERFRAGGGEVVGMQKMRMVNAVNSQVKGVREILYPAEFEIERKGWGFGPQPQRAKLGPQLLPTPGVFETRELGYIFNSTSVGWSRSSFLVASIICERTELSRWNHFGPDPGTRQQPGRVSQPVFRFDSACTVLALELGEPLVVGGGSVAGEDKVWYGIVTAREIESGERR